MIIFQEAFMIEALTTNVSEEYLQITRRILFYMNFSDGPGKRDFFFALSVSCIVIKPQKLH